MGGWLVAGEAATAGAFARSMLRCTSMGQPLPPERVGSFLECCGGQAVAAGPSVFVSSGACVITVCCCYLVGASGGVILLGFGPPCCAAICVVSGYWKTPQACSCTVHRVWAGRGLWDD